MSFSLYIAGALQQKEEIAFKMAQLDKLGHRITYNWTQESSKARNAVRCLEGIEKADTVVAYLGKKGKSKVWFEIGSAISHKKEIVVIGKRLKYNPFSHLPHLVYLREWDDFVEWLFSKSQANICHLASRFLTASAYVEKNSSIDWISDLLSLSSKDESQWYHDPPLSLVLINSKGYKDVSMIALKLNSEGYHLEDDTLRFEAMVGDEIYYMVFEHHSQGKYWVENVPDLNIGVHYLKFYKQWFNSKYSRMPSHMGDHHLSL